jgi:putative ABC transport system substrate-binding protein
VFAVTGDPVATGLVASLARPGGNVTGLSLQQDEVAGKRLELLREFVPDLKRLGVLFDVNHAEGVLEQRKVHSLAIALGFEVANLEIRGVEDIALAFETHKGGMDALYVCGGPLMATHRGRINTLILGARLPVVFDARVYVETGGLMSYGPNFPDLYRRAAELADKILRGAKPQDIPVEQPTKFDLVVNAVTAKALGLSVPPTLLARADEVIE